MNRHNGALGADETSIVMVGAGRRRPRNGASSGRAYLAPERLAVW